MLTTDVISLVIAFISLLVSAFSFFYARKAFNLELRKYREEKKSKDVILYFSKTGRDFYQNYMILITEVEIRNSSLSVKSARYLNAVLHFDHSWRRSHASMPEVEIRAGIDNPIALYSAPHDIAHLLDTHEAIRMVVVDSETEERVIFSQDAKKSLESEPISYFWKVYTIIPQEIIEYLSQQNLKLVLFTLELKIYPEEWKSSSTNHFPFRSGNFSPTVLKHLFGNKQDNKGTQPIRI